MRLDELINSNYDKLNENDLLIWQYIQKHKKNAAPFPLKSWRQSAVFPGRPFPDLHKNSLLRASVSLRCT